MKYKLVSKGLLSVIFTFILSLIMLVLPVDNLLAAQINEEPVESVDSELTLTKNSREFTHDPISEKAKAYLVLGGFYKDNGYYSTSKPYLERALGLAEVADNKALRLGAISQLITVRSMLDELDENEAKFLLEQIKEEYKAFRGVRVLECGLDCLPAKPGRQEGYKVQGLSSPACC